MTAFDRIAPAPRHPVGLDEALTYTRQLVLAAGGTKAQQADAVEQVKALLESVVDQQAALHDFLLSERRVS